MTNADTDADTDFDADQRDRPDQPDELDLDTPMSPAMTAVRRALDVAWWVFLAVIATPVLLILGLIVTYGVERAVPEDYPTVAREDMVRRITDRSQDAYEVLGFDEVVPTDAQNSLSGDHCYPNGLESVADTPVTDAYRLSHSWTLAGIPETEALPALRRLETHLKEEGWRIREFEELKSSDGEWELRAERDGATEEAGIERMVFTWMREGGRFYGGSHGGCAYEPAGSDLPADDIAPELRPKR
ncbi:hypothetical protein [Streptomyces sp. NPDC002187]|uniref:hypothetical protein n=1 Tax=Streptomyces sp. NPDC002187 TaxID=3364637 RepID=UPI0036CC2686